MIALLLFVFWQAAGFTIAYSYVTRDHHNLEPLTSPQERGLACLDVRIPSDCGDGTEIQLAAWLLPADADAPQYKNGATIIMLHGFGSSRAKIWEDPEIGYQGSQLDQGGESLVRAGFHVVMLDFRNHGDSEDHGHVTLGYNEIADVRAAVRWVREKLPEYIQDAKVGRIGLRGSSMGGAVALMAASMEDGLDVDAVWADSAFATADEAVTDFLTHFEVPYVLLPPVKFWVQQLTGVSFENVKPIGSIDRIQCPTMIAHSSDDTMICVDHFERFANATQPLNNVQCWKLSGVQHNRLWTLPGYLDRQVRFFQEHLTSDQPPE